MGRNRFRPGLVMLGVALVGCLVAAATYRLAAPARGEPNVVRASLKPVRTTPTAAAFGQTFVTRLNAYARSRGDSRQLANVHCVEAAKGHYLCSYVVVTPGGQSECHVMQASWTPKHPVTVLRAGRTDRCETLRAALRSLR